MNEVLIFAGTTEGRKLSERLSESGVRHVVCVATEYGEIVLKPHPLAEVRRGRMQQEEIEGLLQTGRFLAVVDATHPYAQEITRRIKAAAERTYTPYMRLKRESAAQEAEKGEGGRRTTGTPVFFETNEECERALERTEGRILLTTGSKELSEYCISEEVRKRLYVRVLPNVESLLLCREHGICGKQIIAMQGPFTAEMNEAVIRQYGISCLVTKESGVSGGYPEKLRAAEKTGIQVFAVGRPKEEEGDFFPGICSALEEICGKRLSVKGELEIVLAGVGMGHESGMTKEVREFIEEADILLGAERLLEGISSKAEKYPFYQAEQVLFCLRDVLKKDPFGERKKAGILFSGDSGFYSGCGALYAALQEEIREGGLPASVHIMPGISSVACLAACIGESYQDAAIYSMHGKKVCNLARKIQSSRKMFLLTSGVRDVNQIGEILTEAGMTDCQVVVGYQLSYEEQRIQKYTPEKCRGLRREGLYTCFIKNPSVTGGSLTHGRGDGEFIRGKVPMTKEEVREVVVCKLHLCRNAVVYDIGSGTGSVAVEIAGLSDDIQVYAVEKRKEAVSLIRKNREKFGLQNIVITEASAPEGLTELPAATHAFIGGSGGRMQEILTELRRVNPKMRIVLSAVSMETICEIRTLLSKYPIKDEEIIQLQANRVKKAGACHLLQAENPVWICAFEFAG